MIIRAWRQVMPLVTCVATLDRSSGAHSPARVRPARFQRFRDTAVTREEVKNHLQQESGSVGGGYRAPPLRPLSQHRLKAKDKYKSTVSGHPRWGRWPPRPQALGRYPGVFGNWSRVQAQQPEAQNARKGQLAIDIDLLIGAEARRTY